MKKCLQTLIAMILLVFVCAGLVSCSDKQVDDGQGNLPSGEQDAASANHYADAKEHELHVADYTLIRQDGKNYLVFDDMSLYNNGEGQVLANVFFESLSQFKDSVTNGKLNNEQKGIAATFAKDNDGRILTCDFDKLLKPKMPNEFKIDSVSWEGTTYGCGISASSGVSGDVGFTTQDNYDRIFAYDKSFLHTTEFIITDDGKTVTKIAGQRRISVRYTHTEGNKTIVVDERYDWESDKLEVTSDMVPKEITMYCTEPGTYYIVRLEGFTEKPSESWLYSFGAQPYVDSGTVKE